MTEITNNEDKTSNESINKSANKIKENISEINNDFVLDNNSIHKTRYNFNLGNY